MQLKVNNRICNPVHRNKGPEVSTHQVKSPYSHSYGGINTHLLRVSAQKSLGGSCAKRVDQPLNEISNSLDQCPTRFSVGVPQAGAPQANNSPSQQHIQQSSPVCVPSNKGPRLSLTSSSSSRSISNSDHPSQFFRLLIPSLLRTFSCVNSLISRR